MLYESNREETSINAALGLLHSGQHGVDLSVVRESAPSKGQREQECLRGSHAGRSPKGGGDPCQNEAALKNDGLHWIVASTQGLKIAQRIHPRCPHQEQS